MSVLLVDAGPVGFRLGALDGDGAVVRLHHEVPGRAEARLGALYRAKVHTVDARLGGAFCVLDGAGTQGFLPAKGKPPRVGETLTVGVRREAIGAKACQLVPNPALRLPGATARRGRDGTALAPGPFGEGDAARMEALCAAAFGGAEAGPVEGVPPLIRALTAFADGGAGEVRACGADAASLLRAWLGPLDVPVSLYEPPAIRAPLDEAEDEALRRVAPLPGGGRVVFDEAEALTAIDVDTGGRGARSARGAEAAVADALLSVIGRQAALRGLGGQIVLDLPRRAFASPKILRDRLTRALRPLGAVSIPAVTNEGVVVVIAPRAEPSLLERLTELHGEGVRPGRRLRGDVVAMRACRALEAALLEDRSAVRTLSCPARARPYVEAALPDLAARYGERARVEEAEGEPVVR